MKVAACGKWFDYLNMMPLQEGLILERLVEEYSDTEVFQNFENISVDTDLICLDADHTNYSILIQLAKKGVNVLCQGLWNVENYLDVIREFKRNNKFVIEDESFLNFEKVGSGGAHLSGGERQRIAIARAMLKDAPIVILDEATAYIDPENEAVIQEAIAKLVKGKTVIVIAHRLSTIKDADKIVVVKDGRIMASGRHEELRESCPLYESMWQAHIGAKDGDVA